jgi:hypothetical protein
MGGRRGLAVLLISATASTPRTHEDSASKTRTSFGREPSQGTASRLFNSQVSVMAAELDGLPHAARASYDLLTGRAAVPRK